MQEPTLKEIKIARDKCAQVIALYGEKYLPIFQRLEDEIINREKQNRLLEKAIKIGTQNGTQLMVHFSSASK